MTVIYIPRKVAVKAATRYVVDQDCYVSTYSTASHGYAQIGWQEPGGPMRGTTAHRAAWVCGNDQIPEGLTVDHICKNRKCVRLDHLRILSNYENGRRTAGRDWPLGQCINGHPNSELRHNGTKLICVPCDREAKRRYRERRRQGLV